MIGELYPGEFEAMEHNGRMDALEQEPCGDWYDVSSNEMTLEQARQAVKDLRKKLAEYLEQKPCPNAISRSDMLDAVGHGMTYTSEELQKIIKGLPPVNAQQKYEDIAKAFQFGMAFGFGEKHNKMDKVINEITKVITPQPKTGYWISVSERLPDDFGTYLITLENGDVCKCEFNPDFIDEEHENGAFTYYHQYFDGATLGMIDEEEEAVDAIAWMPFEPYEPQESEDKE